MSIGSASNNADVPRPQDPEARLAFVGNVHRLVAMGYDRVNASDYGDATEDRITQYLCRALEQVVEAPDAPRWACHFAIQEKRRQNAGGSVGNERLELDIVLQRTGRGSHPRFVIEAKRMGPSHPASVYLGNDGLGAFISCEYAPEHTDAGMLGYVQSRTMEHWRDQLSFRLTPCPGNHQTTQDGSWQAHPFKGGPSLTFRTRHERAAPREPIIVYHTLLDLRSQAG